MHGGPGSDSAVAESEQHDLRETDLPEEDIETSIGPEISLLKGHTNNYHADSDIRDYKITAKGRVRAYWFGTVVCLGGFLLGYDTGIIGGVLTLPSFQRDLDFDEDSAARVSSLAVGLQQLGAFVACFAIWPVTHKLGRKPAIVICSAIFVLGAMMQTVAIHSRTTFFTGRILSGVGLGGSSTIVPMFSSEMMPKQIRGQVGSFYQLMFTLGIFTSYWTDWGVANDIPDTESRQWQIPIGLQVLFAMLLGCGTMSLKESTRWLTMKRRHPEALESLKWIRASDGDDVHLEMEEIRQGVEEEIRAKDEFQLRDMIHKGNGSRTFTAMAMFIAQQATGASAFAYYGPQYFKLLVGGEGHLDLLLTALFGAVKVIACSIFVVVLADRFPRKVILTGGALLMAVCQVSTAALVRSNPVPEDGPITNSGIATVALIYLFVTFYNFSWGPLTWPYVAEIFPARIREPGMAVAVATQCLGNFVFSIATPYMIKNLGWGTFVLWGFFGCLIALYGWFGLVETKGKSLEQIAHLSEGVVKANNHRD